MITYSAKVYNKFGIVNLSLDSELDNTFLDIDEMESLKESLLDFVNDLQDTIDKIKNKSIM